MALSERSEFSHRPGKPFFARVARRAGAAGRVSLDTFLPRSKKVSRLPGRVPARMSHRDCEKPALVKQLRYKAVEQKTLSSP